MTAVERDLSVQREGSNEKPVCSGECERGPQVRTTRNLGIKGENKSRSTDSQSEEITIRPQVLCSTPPVKRKLLLNKLTKML